MIDKIAKFWQTSDKLTLIPTIISFACFFLIITLYLSTYSILPPMLPLFYSLPWGEAQLINKQQFFILPAVLVLITLINLLISSQLHPVQRVLKRTLMLSLILVNIALLITTIKILFIFV